MLVVRTATAKPVSNKAKAAREPGMFEVGAEPECESMRLMRVAQKGNLIVSVNPNCCISNVQMGMSADEADVARQKACCRTVRLKQTAKNPNAGLEFTGTLCTTTDGETRVEEEFPIDAFVKLDVPVPSHTANGTLESVEQTHSRQELIARAMAHKALYGNCKGAFKRFVLKVPLNKTFDKFEMPLPVEWPTPPESNASDNAKAEFESMLGEAKNRAIEIFKTHLSPIGLVFREPVDPTCGPNGEVYPLGEQDRAKAEGREPVALAYESDEAWQAQGPQPFTMLRVIPDGKGQQFTAPEYDAYAMHPLHPALWQTVLDFIRETNIERICPYFTRVPPCRAKSKKMLEYLKKAVMSARGALEKEYTAAKEGHAVARMELEEDAEIDSDESTNTVDKVKESEIAMETIVNKLNSMPFGYPWVRDRATGKLCPLRAQNFDAGLSPLDLAAITDDVSLVARVEEIVLGLSLTSKRKRACTDDDRAALEAELEEAKRTADSLRRKNEQLAQQIAKLQAPELNRHYAVPDGAVVDIGGHAILRFDPKFSGVVLSANKGVVLSPNKATDIACMHTSSDETLTIHSIPRASNLPPREGAERLDGDSD